MEQLVSSHTSLLVNIKLSTMILTSIPPIVTVVANENNVIETEVVTATGTGTVGTIEIYRSLSCNYDIISSALARCYDWIGTVLPTATALEGTGAPGWVPFNTEVYLVTVPATATATSTSSESSKKRNTVCIASFSSISRLN
jgi:hypothetical protein